MRNTPSSKFESFGLNSPAARRLADELQDDVNAEIHTVVLPAFLNIVERLNAYGQSRNVSFIMRIRKLKPIRIVLITWLASSLSTFCLAQQVHPGGIATRKFKHKGQIASSYDKSSNKTTVVLNPYDIPASAADQGENKEYFSIMCGFIYQGRTMTAYPETVEFHIISDGTRGFKFDDQKKRTLSIDIDDERIRLGTMTLVRSKHFAFGSSPVNLARNGYLEEVSIILTYQGLVKIAAGKKVSLFVGQQKIVLHNEHLEALRDLTSRINL